MKRGLLVTGTDTEVGKTFVTCVIARLLRRRGINVGVMKPVACGAVQRGGISVSEDALALKAAAGVDDPLETINPLLFGPPLAPVPAAEMSGATAAVAALEDAFRDLCRKRDLVLVEGVGGILVPLVRGLTIADLAARWDLPVVVVARPSLGTVNHTLLTVEAARRRGLDVAGVVFTSSISSRQGDAERTGPGEIVAEGAVENLGEIPYLDIDPAADLDSLADACAARLSLDTILCFLK